MHQPAPNGSDQPSADDREERIREAVDAGFPTTVAELSGLVRIPSVAWAGFDHAHVAASAEAVAELLRGVDVFETVEIARAPMEGSAELGQPAVLARRAARNGRPTVLLYAHHDVQPPGDDAGWDSPPFEPTARGDRLYGRGAADDKAGIMAHVAAIRALVAAGGDPDLGIALFIEGRRRTARARSPTSSSCTATRWPPMRSSWPIPRTGTPRRRRSPSPSAATSPAGSRCRPSRMPRTRACSAAPCPTR
ncbi:hypothetical protein GCM10025877_32630 [Agromyces mangrovi Wang et al. 2018]|nr:hypothetical protein GCM10025877_32630 [Agromyces mangrovi]